MHHVKVEIDAPARKETYWTTTDAPCTKATANAIYSNIRRFYPQGYILVRIYKNESL